MMFLSKKENYAESSEPLADGNKNKDRNSLLFVCSLLFMIGGVLISLHAFNKSGSKYALAEGTDREGAKSVMAVVGLLIVYIGIENLLLVLRKDQSKDQSHIDNHRRNLNEKFLLLIILSALLIISSLCYPGGNKLSMEPIHIHQALLVVVLVLSIVGISGGSPSKGDQELPGYVGKLQDDNSQ